MTPKIKSELMKFFALIPEGFECVIAGGAAVGLGLHQDVDLWLLGKDQIIEDDLTLLGTALNPNPGVDYAFKDDAGYEISEFRTVAAGTLYGVKFQIHATPMNLDALLNHFDLSCVQIALTRSGVEVHGLGYTAPNKAIRVTNFHTPLRTIERLIRHAARYGVPLSSDDQKITLLNRALDQEKKRLANIAKREALEHNAGLELNLIDEEIPF